MNRWLYRLRQGWRQLVYTRANSADRVASAYLSEAALALFMAMSPADRDHSGCVLDALLKCGPISPELAQAALLHDCAKAQAGLTLCHRTLIVILRRYAPALWHSLSSRDTPSWRRPYYISARHAEIGAELAVQAGCSQRTAWLISRHDLLTGDGKGIIPDKELLALRQADNAC